MSGTTLVGSGSRWGANILRTTSADCGGPTSTNALTSAHCQISKSSGVPSLIRDEEVVGSNPATPTRKHGPTCGNAGRAIDVHESGVEPPPENPPFWREVRSTNDRKVS